MVIQQVGTVALRHALSSQITVVATMALFTSASSLAILAWPCSTSTKNRLTTQQPTTSLSLQPPSTLRR